MDNLLEKSGSFGKFQKLMFVLIGTSAILSGLTAFISVFNNAVPELLCSDKTKNSESTEKFLENSCEIRANISKSESLNQESPFECFYDTSKSKSKINHLFL